MFVRIFVLFWLAMTVIAGGSIAVTDAIATREFESHEWQRHAPVELAAAEALAAGGPARLRAWVAANEHRVPGHDLFVVGPDGRDILGRPLSPPAIRRLRLGRRAAALVKHDRTQGIHLQPMRPSPRLVTADGAAYTILVVPRRSMLFGAFALPGIPPAVLAIALIVSAIASGWLARHLSAPIRRMQAGARALASDNLAVRVSVGLDGRRDELAVLAREFDAMADQLRATRAARTRLLRDISHELRSPLARMRVAVALARRSPSDSARQTDRMEREIERLDALIGQVLKLARLQDESPRLDLEPVDLGELLTEIVSDANYEAAAKRGSVRFAADAPIEVAANRELVRSAIENVLRNAIRYSPEGAAVEVDLRAFDDAARISIRDHGPGVPAADLARIFEPFYRVAESRDRDSGGEGIGLAITAQVLRAHGGGARASNRPDGGLEVVLELPRRPTLPGETRTV